jgi:hypothetical protein
LPKYGLWSVDKAAALFARWAADEIGGANPPALCRRCGRVLDERHTPSQQLHAATCAPPFWPHPAPPAKTVVAPCQDASRRPTMTDPIAELIDAASETLRASMHIPAVPEYPSDLYRRSGNLVDLLGKLAQVVRRLDDTLKHLPQTWELDSDDSSPAAAHLTTASFTLRATGAALDDAYRHANEAHSALSHLKLS